MNDLTRFIQQNTGLSDNIQYKILVTILIIVFFALLRFFILRFVWKHTKDVKTRYGWKRSLSFIFPFLNVVLIGAVWIRAFEQFGTFLGLFTAGIAIALKDPLTNLAGWLFILFRKPFVVGDRVQIGDYKGDIIDIRLFQFTMLEIGNWIDAEQSTGRIIHLPNGKVFLEPQANYSSGFEYIWNEIPVCVTFESNWEKAKEILTEIICNYTQNEDVEVEKEIQEASKNYMIYYKKLTPVVYVNVKESGILLTIRYLCNPRNRRGSENELWQTILTHFNERKDIDFAYPTTRFYRREEGGRSLFEE